MLVTIDYYLSLTSPWTYLGSARFAEIAERNGATVNIKPCKFGPIFEQTGGLPLPKRSPQRRAYRMMELKRWREALGIPINLEPKHFPCDDVAATRLVIAAGLQGRRMRTFYRWKLGVRCGNARKRCRSRSGRVGRPARRSRRRGAARERSFGTPTR
jgi:2-hydroxychromene-2-carboxylate isomerase